MHRSRPQTGPPVPTALTAATEQSGAEPGASWLTSAQPLRTPRSRRRRVTIPAAGRGFFLTVTAPQEQREGAAKRSAPCTLGVPDPRACSPAGPHQPAAPPPPPAPAPQAREDRPCVRSAPRRMHARPPARRARRFVRFPLRPRAVLARLPLAPASCSATNNSDLHWSGGGPGVSSHAPPPPFKGEKIMQARKKILHPEPGRDAGAAAALAPVTVHPGLDLLPACSACLGWGLKLWGSGGGDLWLLQTTCSEL